MTTPAPWIQHDDLIIGPYCDRELFITDDGRHHSIVAVHVHEDDGKLIAAAPVLLSLFATVTRRLRRCEVIEDDLRRDMEQLLARLQHEDALPFKTASATPPRPSRRLPQTSRPP